MQRQQNKYFRTTHKNPTSHILSQDLTTVTFLYNTTYTLKQKHLTVYVSCFVSFCGLISMSELCPLLIYVQYCMWIYNLIFSFVWDSSKSSHIRPGTSVTVSLVCAGRGRIAGSVELSTEAVALYTQSSTVSGCLCSHVLTNSFCFFFFLTFLSLIGKNYLFYFSLCFVLLLGEVEHIW